MIRLALACALLMGCAGLGGCAVTATPTFWEALGGAAGLGTAVFKFDDDALTAYEKAHSGATPGP